MWYVLHSTICDVIQEQPLYQEQHYQHAAPHNLQCAIIPATKMQMLQQRAEHEAVQGTLLSLCLPNPTQHNFYSRAQEKASVTQSIFTLYMNERQSSVCRMWAMMEAAALQHCTRLQAGDRSQNPRLGSHLLRTRPGLGGLGATLSRLL